MKHCFALTSLTAACLAVAASEGGARPVSGEITPGRAIAHVELGMSATRAHRILRRAGAGILTYSRRLSPGVSYLEFEYRSPDTGPVSYVLGVQGRSGQRRVVIVKTFERANRTREKVGPGSTATKLLRTYRRGLRCRELVGPGAFVGTACVLGSAKQRNTVFVLDRARGTSPSTVFYVFVREPFAHLSLP